MPSSVSNHPNLRLELDKRRYPTPSSMSAVTRSPWSELYSDILRSSNSSGTNLDDDEDTESDSELVNTLDSYIQSLIEETMKDVRTKKQSENKNLNQNQGHNKSTKSGNTGSGGAQTVFTHSDIRAAIASQTQNGINLSNSAKSQGTNGMNSSTAEQQRINEINNRPL